MATRDQLVETAADLIQRRGYAATGVAQVLADSGTTKGSLYFHFPGGKEELAAAALEHRATSMATFIEHLLDASPDVATAVAAFAAALAARLEESGWERGCGLATATLDAATESEAIRDACADGYRSWHALLAGALEREGLAPDDAAGEATLALSALEGALILARAEQDCTPLHTAGRRLAARISACAASPLGQTGSQ